MDANAVLLDTDGPEFEAAVEATARETGLTRREAAKRVRLDVLRSRAARRRP